MSMFDLLHENVVQDNVLLQSNDEHGDVFSTPRDVDFAFKTPDKTKANDLCDFINGKNFAKAHVRQAEGDDLVWVIAIIHMPINQNVLCSVSGFMVCLSRLFLVEYDGWGSVIQPEPPSAILEKP